MKKLTEIELKKFLARQLPERIYIDPLFTSEISWFNFIHYQDKSNKNRYIGPFIVETEWLQICQEILKKKIRLIQWKVQDEVEKIHREINENKSIKKGADPILLVTWQNLAQAMYVVSEVWPKWTEENN